MDHETLFTASKWEILKRLEKGPVSPLELSHLCSTSIANISQQLRLLEMAGLVVSRRISNRDKGKPRVLYSLAGNLSYVIAASGDFVDKRVLELSECNKIIMRIWFSPRKQLQYTLEKAFWRIEEYLPRIAFLAVDATRDAPVTIYVKFNGKSVDLKPFTITDAEGTVRQVIFEDCVPAAKNIHILYDPRGMAAEKKEQSQKKHTGDTV